MKNKHYPILSRIIILFLYTIGSQGCLSNKKSINLFLLTHDEHLSINQEKQRLKYAKLLQPEVNGDSLVIPKVKNIPVEFQKYMKTYTDSLNKFLHQIPEEDKYQLLFAFMSNSIETSIINSYIEKKNNSYILNITQKKAIKLGLKKEYEKAKSFIDNLNIALPNYTPDISNIIEAVFEKPRSIFWNPMHFNKNLKGYDKISNCILNLHNKST